MEKTVVENVMVAEIWGLVMPDYVFEAMRTLLGVFRLGTVASERGGGNIGVVHSFIIHGENPRSLISCISPWPS
jgi:hypothetical protein